MSKNRSLANIAGIVAVATLISKIFGLFREQAIAAVFGVGPVINAYAYAYVLPGFLLILLGGINGPFHSAIVSVLSKRDKKEAASIVETVTTIVSVVLLLVTIILIFLADYCIDFVAPGLDPAVRKLAIEQLEIMSPLALFAGLIGIGFGTLNIADQYWLPSISPLFSSLITLIGLGIFGLVVGKQINTADYLQLGGVILAGTTLAGGILQWLVQVISQWKAGLGTLRLRFNWRTPGVSDVFKIMIPATLSSGMLHINVYTDLFFASFIPDAAAAMRYASFIVLTPLGIISNMILVPFFPVFSRLTAPENWPELKIRIRQGIFLTALSMLPLTAIFMALSLPIVQIIYQRGAFNLAASEVVVPVLMAYGFGMFFYLARDVLVRVFYALGDGEIPAKVSIINIFLNAILDFFLVGPFKTPGLVLATVSVNVISMLMFLWILNRRLGGLSLGNWGITLGKLIGIAVVSGFTAWGVYLAWEHFITSRNLLLQIIGLSLSSLASLTIFFGLALQLKLPELNMLIDKIGQKIKKSM